MDALVLQPLPFPKANQHVVVYQQDTKNRDSNHFVAPIRLKTLWGVDTRPGDLRWRVAADPSGRDRRIIPPRLARPED